MTIEEMRKELVKLEELEYDKFPMDEEKEQTFDDAYKNQYDCFMDISIAIVELTRGTVDIANARAMVNGKREQLKRIFNIA